MYFDEIAYKWDTKRRIERAKILANSIYDNLSNTEEMAALEIGCGTGLITLELCDKFHEIYCMDASKEMLNIINEKIISADIHNVFTCGINLLDKDVFHGKFDIIFSSMVFHHIVNVEDEFKKLHRFLKENGYLVIIDLDKVDERFHKEELDFCGYHGFERINIQKCIERAGFRNIRFQTVYTGDKAIDNEIVPYSLFLCIAKSN